MNLQEKWIGLERLGTDWRLLLTRGLIMLVMGIFLSLASAFNPDGSIMYGSDLSWLPVCGLVIVLVGVLECLDAYIAKELSRFFLHLQNGVFDTVVGCVIFLSIGSNPDRLSLMLVSYLIVKATLRMFLVNVTQLPQRQSMILVAMVSIVLGFMIWMQWPTPAAWFMSLCLGLDIALRGWSQMLFSFWLRTQTNHE